MNRLLLIGNGFDLAHGMKTSYVDFTTNYLQRCFKMARLHYEYEDDLIRVIRNPLIDFSDIGEQGVLNLLRQFPFAQIGQSDLKIEGRIKETIDKYPRFPLLFSFKNKFLNSIFTSISNKRWVDIEVEYYKNLLSLPQTSDYEIIKLNKSFGILRDELISYLNQQSLPQINDSIRNILCTSIDEVAEKSSNYTSKLYS